MARTIKRAYARYSESFKAEAVRLASQPGILVQAVAQSLDISPLCAVTMAETIA
jgi:transposase-like protein